ncbi:MAG TPA: hypothetical protein VFW71_05035 [Actinomycetota bacterium]|nr:hypothetical protein [Actinomycetota bacterium]
MSGPQKRRPAPKGKPGGRRPPPAAGRGPPVVGKHPSPPGFLLAVALAWFAAAIGALVILHAGWKLIPVVVFAGIGLLYLRGAMNSYLRRPGPPEKK